MDNTLIIISLHPLQLFNENCKEFKDQDCLLFNKDSTTKIEIKKNGRLFNFISNQTSNIENQFIWNLNKFVFAYPFFIRSYIRGFIGNLLSEVEVITDSFEKFNEIFLVLHGQDIDDKEGRTDYEMSEDEKKNYLDLDEFDDINNETKKKIRVFLYTASHGKFINLLQNTSFFGTDFRYDQFLAKELKSYSIAKKLQLNEESILDGLYSFKDATSIETNDLITTFDMEVKKHTDLDNEDYAELRKIQETLYETNPENLNFIIQKVKLLFTKLLKKNK
jgi:hypothetical protein